MTDDRQICPGDEDWFSIQLNRSEILTVELLFDHSQRGDLDMEIYRAGAAPDALELIQVSESSTDDETAVTLPAQEREPTSFGSMVSMERVTTISLVFT